MIQAVGAIGYRRALESYYLLYAVLGEFEAQLGNNLAAARHLKRAMDLAELESERAFLAGRLRECEAPSAR